MRANGIVVTLDGQGSDELIGGYGQYVHHALVNTGGYLHAPFRTLELAKILNEMYSPGDQLHHYPLYACLGRGSPILRLLGSIYKHRRNPKWILALERQRHEQMETQFESGELQGLSALGRFLYFDVHRGYLPKLNSGFDLHSMSHSIEVRLPFLDWRLVNFVLALPDTSKLGRGYTKLILRDAMARFSPPQIYLRKTKLGFNAPLRAILSRFREMRQWFIDQLHEPEFQSAHPQYKKISQRLANGNKKTWEINTSLIRTIILFWYRTKWATYGRQQSISGDVNSSAMVVH
jgi:asparagine synthase (glutamine-hydrolysing)